jgi:predicted nucleic acid-binding protein
LSIYADSSFFVSAYLTDKHSHEARQAIGRGPRLWLTLLHRAEWTNAVAQHVFRRVLTGVQARGMYSDFDRDRVAGLWAEVELPSTAFQVCIELAHLYTPRIGTRTIDTLHVAAALQLGAERFWTFDDRQAKLAKAVGLKLK